jgi:hypothetical protein
MSRNENGITFWDVAYAARDIGKAHAVHIRFSLDLPIGQNVSKAFNVRCAAWKSSKKGDWYDSRGVSLPWPYSECRTFSGLLYRLVYDLDQALTDDEAKQAKRLSPLELAISRSYDDV